MAPGSATHAEPLCHRGVLRVGHPTGRVRDSATHAVPPWAKRLKALKYPTGQFAAPAVSGPTIGVSASVEAEDVPEGERKLVTALFADIKGSTELIQDLDPEDARRVIDPALKIMIDAVHHYDGYVVQSTGDGIFALFGAPVAHEDHPQRAVLTALRMQQEIKRLTSRLRAEGRAPLQIRVGLNTGEVVVRPIQTGAKQIEYTPIGHTANLASRMQTLADPGSVVSSRGDPSVMSGLLCFQSIGAGSRQGSQ